MENINIINYKCVGCHSCEQICPNSCIKIDYDNEGFLYPNVNEDLCTECGLCLLHCPINHSFLHVIGQEAYGIVLKNKKTLMKSSSGGVFAGLATYFIENKGYVFGASLNENFDLQQVCIDKIEQIEQLQGSKYFFCDTNNSYKKVKDILQKTNKKVLFTGTPCQIAGLKSFLNKEYDNLYTMDIVCHGVPSRKMFLLYIDYLERKIGGKILSYIFRDKENGWGCGQKITIKYMKKNEIKRKVIIGSCDPYMHSFIKRTIQRESCYDCKFMNIDRVSDFTVGDFWEVSRLYPEVDTSQGVSLCILNTDKAKRLFNIIKDSFLYFKSSIQDVSQGNIHLVKSSNRPLKRNTTYKSIKKGKFSKRDLNYSPRLLYEIITILSKICPKKIKLLIKKVIKK